MFGLIKKIFIGLLTGLVNGSNQTKCISLSNQKCIIQPTFVNLHPNDIVENLTIIYLHLNEIDVLQVVSLLLLFYLTKYVYQIKQKI